MKFIKLFSMLLFMTIALNAQKIQMRTTTGELYTYGSQRTLTTTDSAYHTIDSIAMASNTAGMVEVSVTGLATASGNSVTGSQIARFNKRTGSLTLGSPVDLLAIVTDGALGTATWDIAVSASNNLLVRIKGHLATSIRWRSLIKHIYP